MGKILNRIEWGYLFPITVFVLFLTIFLIKGYVTSFYFDGFPADGAFQTFNPLSRIAD
jgi:hypothetical protein